MKLPAATLSYIKEHFKEGDITGSRALKNSHGQLIHRIEVTENEVIYQLDFNDEGKLLNRASWPVYDEDYYEGDFYGDEDTPVI